MKSRVANESLAELMDRHTVAGAAELCHVEGERLRCVACGHRCLIADGLRGICKVRYNEGGQLKVPFGYVAGVQCDPVEKKPFFHVYPGSDALTFGMLGCDLHCPYCQNWLTSQALRDSNAVAPLRPITPEQLIGLARREQARLVVSSYNEPLITAEWAVSVFQEAKAAGLACAFVSNGNATTEVLDYLRPWIVAYKVDLKGFTESGYRSLGGTLENITRTIQLIHERGLWLEIVTLVIPGFNDGEEELRQAARFIASVSRDIPWHVTAFHQDYKMTEPLPTQAAALMRAAEIGTAEGLRFVYAGNLPGQVGHWENTRCPHCQATLIERFGYLVRSYRLTPEGCCPACQTQLPGVWPGRAAEVKTGHDQASYRNRLPRALHVAEMRPVEKVERGRLPLASVTSSAPLSWSSDRPLLVTSAVGTPPMTLAPLRPIANQRPELNEPQRRRLLTQVTALLHALVANYPVAPLDWAELRDLPLDGAFVTLKRGNHLRACCGLLGQPVPLSQALEQAAARTAREDERFPTISTTELAHLDVEIWLLFNLQPVSAHGEARLQALTLGQHGVKVVRGNQGALFLPSVATEQHWDARQLLDRVCVKAGLAPSLWRDEQTTLFTFEGECLHGRLADALVAPLAPRSARFRAEDLRVYANFCRDNLAHLLSGRVPSYFLMGAPDGNVNGVVLSLHRPNGAESTHFSQLSMRHGLPIQTTLFNFTQAAAQQLTAERITPALFNDLRVSITLLYDPAVQGTVADPQLAGLDATQRALLVLERQKSAMLYNPHLAPEALLTEAAAQARVTEPASAGVFSFQIATEQVPLSIANVPKPVRGPAVRPAAVAGRFYEADPAELAKTLDRLMAGERRPEVWRAAMVPHAGLMYSGALAAAVLKRLHIPQTIIVIGPKHTNLGMDWAVAPQQTWELPGLNVESHFLLARQLCQAIPGLEMDAAAHQQEHAIEVELPLIARLAPEARVVGIAIGHATLDDCRRIATGLANVLREREDKPLLLISSDMNHFATDAETRRLDALALSALERGDAAELHEVVMRNNISMCGVLPAVIVLETLRLLGGPRKAEQVGYATTADVTGDTSRVVGYAGMLFA